MCQKLYVRSGDISNNIESIIHDWKASQALVIH